MPIVRNGTPEDLAEVARIQSECPQAAQWNPADYLAYDFLVATCAEVVCGFAVALAIGAGEAEILNVAVAPALRRHGVGRALVGSLLARFRGAVFLEVRASNAAARMFYNSMGFKEVSIRNEYYDSPPEPAIVMKFHSC